MALPTDTTLLEAAANLSHVSSSLLVDGMPDPGPQAAAAAEISNMTSAEVLQHLQQQLQAVFSQLPAAGNEE